MVKTIIYLEEGNPYNLDYVENYQSYVKTKQVVSQDTAFVEVIGEKGNRLLIKRSYIAGLHEEPKEKTKRITIKEHDRAISE